MALVLSLQTISLSSIFVLDTMGYESDLQAILHQFTWDAGAAIPRALRLVDQRPNVNQND